MAVPFFSGLVLCRFILDMLNSNIVVILFLFTMRIWAFSLINAVWADHIFKCLPLLFFLVKN